MPRAARSRSRAYVRGLAVALALGVGAGIAVKATERPTDQPELVFRNIAVLVLPFLAAWFAWRRRPPVRTLLGVAAAFAAVALALNLYPFDGGSSNVEVAMENSATAVLATLGSIVALWLHHGHRRRRRPAERPHPDGLPGLQRRVARLLRADRDVGGVLSGSTVAVFASIQVDVMPFIGEWVCRRGGRRGARLGLARGREQRVIEDMAPVLAKVSAARRAQTLALIVASVMRWTSSTAAANCHRLDLVLVVVVALLVYLISARDPALPPGSVRSTTGPHARRRAHRRRHRARRDGRPQGEFGFSANKTAWLGLNIILLVNLAWPRRCRSVSSSARAIRRHRALADGYLPSTSAGRRSSSSPSRRCSASNDRPGQRVRSSSASRSNQSSAARWLMTP